MYGYRNDMPPPWMWPPGPTSTPQLDPAQQIGQWITSLEVLKKHFKEEKKDDKKKDGEQPSVITVALLMVLLSPITGPLMSKFFSMGIGMLPHATP